MASEEVTKWLKDSFDLHEFDTGVAVFVDYSEFDFDLGQHFVLYDPDGQEISSNKLRLDFITDTSSRELKIIPEGYKTLIVLHGLEQDLETLREIEAIDSWTLSRLIRSRQHKLIKVQDN